MAIDSAALVAALKKAAPDAPLPEVRADDAQIELRYDAAAFAARCSADDAAVRGAKGVKVAAAEQFDSGKAIRVVYALAQ